MKSVFTRTGAVLALGLPLCLPAAASAQETVPEDSVLDGDYLAVGAGAVLSPSYTGSDDYVVSPLPIVQGQIEGVQINPRGGGLSLDFVPDGDGDIGLDLGIAARLRADRADQISDDVVKSLGELDRAVEIGPSAGVGFNSVLNPYDSVTVGADVMWDVAGAHDGMVVTPSISYFTPLSRAMIATLSLSAEYGDSDFQDYYFRVTPEQSAQTGGELFAYEPDGGGFTKAGATLLLAYDLSGDVTDGGWGLIGVAGYSRVLGDAKDTPFTSVRGSADQFLLGAGVGYTF